MGDSAGRDRTMRRGSHRCGRLTHRFVRIAARIVVPSGVSHGDCGVLQIWVWWCEPCEQTHKARVYSRAALYDQVCGAITAAPHNNCRQ
jgi:hypothetical protein